MRLRIVAVITTTAIALSASPAEAKGISRLTITGTGVDRAIVVGGDGSMALSRILDAAVVFEALESSSVAGQSALRTPTNPSVPDLGPRLRLTWSVEWSHTQHVVQDLYLYARDGPLLHTPAGQQFFDRTTTSQWHGASPRLVEVLQAVGVPTAAQLRASAAAANRFPSTGSGVIARW